MGTNQIWINWIIWNDSLQEKGRSRERMSGLFGLHDNFIFYYYLTYRQNGMDVQSDNFLIKNALVGSATHENIKKSPNLVTLPSILN